ncbi:CapA family protein [Brevibacillus humidisoli]|uniref:CapA family protein n=1 Tax=Brevibacillus humidisoli TaxID=2895522 RepID=UPI001E55E1EF|nr:CapA family protein [Brevibacillus humidisoli]UFJ42657.1 CapA family protein [Brevibacillus humidisoli]
MTTRVKIAAVGDILMWRRQIASARVGNSNRYSFDNMFGAVAPYLRSADLTIGNLETTLSGRESQYERRNPKTGWPMFNCPDELAAALKRVGFNVLTTANNHCMDRGVRGLVRTLHVLDRHHLPHTGTFRNRQAAQTPLIKIVKGIKFGILAYTYGTNRIPVPQSKPWLVNRIQKPKILRDLKALRPKVDVIIVALHFGQEFKRYPNASQRSLVKTMFQQGADIILGAHPHVLQPMAFQHTSGTGPGLKKKFVIYSLGNFISDRMLNNIHADSGVILNINIQKNDQGEVSITHVNYIPTWVHQRVVKGKPRFRVLPIRRFLRNSNASLSAEARRTMRRVWKNTTSHLRGKPL